MNEHEKTGGDDEHLEKVRQRAHAIWLDEGRVHGRDQEHWHQAEQEITAEEAAGASPKAGATAKDAGGSPVKGAIGQTSEPNPPKPASTR
jgi:hypothetical protein